MFHTEFYPTPASVAYKMLDRLPFSRYSYGKWPLVLDPSAGKGDLLDAAANLILPHGHHDYARQREAVLARMCAIEPVPELRSILAGKGYQLIDRDFLSYFNERSWDVIVMNPPFSDGHKHLRKALEIGKTAHVRCLLNAETLNNPHTKEHALLLQELEARDAEIEMLGPVFAAAERKTNVNVALVKVRPAPNSSQFSFRFQPEQKERMHTVNDIGSGQVAPADVISSLVARYDAARRCAAEVYSKLAELEFYASGLIGSADLREMVGKHSYEGLVSVLREKSWSGVFGQTKLSNWVTSKVREQLEQQEKMSGAMAFTEDNIQDLLLVLICNEKQIMLDVVQESFDLLTKYHKENRVHIEGWKTNEAWRVARKCILPGATDSLDVKFGHHRLGYQIQRKMADIEKALCLIEGVKFNEAQGLLSSIGTSERIETGEWHDSRFFRWKLFKKGTLHIEFKDKELWQRFNRLACEGRNWIGGGFNA
jgi:hypothetical protein